MQTPDTLSARFAISGAVRFENGENGLPMAVLAAGSSVAHVYAHGAHVTHFQPAGREPVLFTSAASHFADGKAIRGGVPVIFPWFGPNAADASLSAHGLVRTRSWRFESSSALPDGRARVELGIGGDEATRAVWPHRFSLRYVVTLGDALEMELRVENTGAEAFDFEEALHTYLAVSDVRRVALTGLSGVDYLDKTDGMKRKTQGDAPIEFAGETDRVYLDTSTACTVDDPGAGRRLIVEKSGSDTTVVWNPWVAKAAALSDFGDDEWPSMLCIETCNADANAVALGPGETHAMRAVVRCG